MYLMGVDVGTSGAKCVITDRNGQVVARASSGYPLETPRPSWAEQDPAWWIDGAFAAIREALLSGGLNGKDIAGLSFSGQMHGLVPLDQKGNVIRKAILWCDQRTQKQCDEIEETAGGRDSLIGKWSLIILPPCGLSSAPRIICASASPAKSPWMCRRPPA